MLGGGLEISAVELARFGALVLNGTLVADLNDLWDDSNTGYSIAWVANELTWNGTRTVITGGSVWHNGSWDGTGTLLEIYPADNLVIAIMANTKRDFATNNQRLLAAALQGALVP